MHLLINFESWQYIFSLYNIKCFLLFFFLTIVTCQTTVCEEHSLPECELFCLCITLKPCRTFRGRFWSHAGGSLSPALNCDPAPLRVWLDLLPLCQSHEVKSCFLRKGKCSSMMLSCCLRWFFLFCKNGNYVGKMFGTMFMQLFFMQWKWMEMDAETSVWENDHEALLNPGQMTCALHCEKRKKVLTV